MNNGTAQNTTKSTIPIFLSISIGVLYLFSPLFASATTIASYTGDAGGAGSYFGYGQSGVLKIAQQFSFTGATSYDLTSATGLILHVSGGTSDTCTASVYTDNGSNVPSTLLQTSSAATCPTGSKTQVTFTFAGTQVLAPSTNYWLVMTTSGAGDGQEQGWEYGTASLLYYAQVKYFDGTNWNNDAGASYNTNFTVVGTAIASASPPPFKPFMLFFGSW